MNDLKHAYFAGFIDGEGTVVIGRKWDVQVTMGQIDPRPLRAIMALFPGHFRLKRPAVKAWRPYWALTIAGNEAVRFLRAMLPYMIVKREQAELALAIMAIKRRGPTRPRLTGWEIAERESYRLALLDLRRDMVA